MVQEFLVPTYRCQRFACSERFVATSALPNSAAVARSAAETHESLDSEHVTLWRVPSTYDTGVGILKLDGMEIISGQRESAPLWAAQELAAATARNLRSVEAEHNPALSINHGEPKIRTIGCWWGERING